MLPFFMGFGVFRHFSSPQITSSLEAFFFFLLAFFFFFTFQNE